MKIIILSFLFMIVFSSFVFADVFLENHAESLENWTLYNGVNVSLNSTVFYDGSYSIQGGSATRASIPFLQNVSSGVVNVSLYIYKVEGKSFGFRVEKTHWQGDSYVYTGFHLTTSSSNNKICNYAQLLGSCVDSYYNLTQNSWNHLNLVINMSSNLSEKIADLYINDTLDPILRNFTSRSGGDFSFTSIGYFTFMDGSALGDYLDNIYVFNGSSSVVVLPNSSSSLGGGLDWNNPVPDIPLVCQGLSISAMMKNQDFLESFTSWCKGSAKCVGYGLNNIFAYLNEFIRYMVGI